jgi:nucleoside-diphosphate-sugar epimerase
MSVYQLSNISKNIIIDEKSQIEKNGEKRGYYTLSKLLADEIVKKEMSPDIRLKVVILRPATIYGPGGELITPLMGLNMFNKLFLILGKKNMKLPIVFIDNLIDAILESIDNEKVNNEIFNIIDDQKISKIDYLKTIKKQVFPKAIILTIPYPILMGLVKVQEMLFKMLRKQPFLTTYKLKSASNESVINNDKVKEKFGWLPRVGLKESLNRTIQWYKIN